MSMNRNELETRVLEMIHAMPGFEDVTAEMDFVEEIGFSSLETMDLIVQLEDEFGVQITPNDLRQIFTPADLTNLLADKVDG